jgi:transcriptional regulator with XRE-family HTH domain
MNNFGTELKRLRMSRDLTVNELADASGISAAQISRIENGKRNTPKADTIQALASALNISPDILMRKAGYSTSDSISEKERSLLDKLSGHPELIDLLIELPDDKLRHLASLLR